MTSMGSSAKASDSFGMSVVWSLSVEAVVASGKCVVSSPSFRVLVALGSVDEVPAMAASSSVAPERHERHAEIRSHVFLFYDAPQLNCIRISHKQYLQDFSNNNNNNKVLLSINNSTGTVKCV